MTVVFYRDLFKREFVEDVLETFWTWHMDRYWLFVHGLWIVHWSCFCLEYWFTGYIRIDRERDCLCSPKIFALSTHSEHLQLCWDGFCWQRKTSTLYLFEQWSFHHGCWGYIRDEKLPSFKKGLPSWELAYPLPRQFWRWFPFPQVEYVY